MLLVTTPIPEAWPPGQHVLLLGDWCSPLLGGREEPHEILPYHWNDQEKAYADFLLLETLHEKLLPQLAKRLNALHGTSHPLRYWRLVTGHWLKLAAYVLLDRFRSIEAAREKTSRTLGLPIPRAALTLATGADFQETSARSDIWNHRCYLSILERLTGIAIEPLGETSIKPFLPGGARRSAVKSFLAATARFLHPPGVPIVTLGLNINPVAGLKLGIGLRQFPFLASPHIVAPASAPDPDRRAMLALPGETAFEDLLGSMLPVLAPKSLVEDFAWLRRRAMDVLPRRPKVIATAQFHANSEALCIWAAEQRESGARLDILQHGGHYGSDQYEAQEEHELRIADRYYSWGWRRSGAANITTMPSMKLSSGKKLVPARDGDVLFIYDAFPPFAYRAFCIPSAGRHDAYIADQIDLLAHLPEKIRGRSVLRLHPESDSYRFDIRDALTRAGHADRIDASGKTVPKLLCQSRLCVIAANATVMLETLSQNYPTILFWAPQSYALRPDAWPFYQALEDAGILHQTAASAAQAIAAAFEAPKAWWSQPSVQDARRHFVAEYARRSDRWVKEWRSELQRRDSMP